MNKAMGLALAMKNKNMSEGGKCYACGGVTGMARGGLVNEQETEDMQPSGEWEEDEEDESEDTYQNFSEGGGVDEQYDPHSVNDPDGDNDDLEYSPEVSAEDFGDDNEEDDDKKSNFLRAYMVNRRLNAK